MGHDLGIFFCVVHGLDTVDFQGHSIACGANFVLVPLPRFHGLLHGFRVRFSEDGVASGFVIQRAIPTLSNVGLVSSHLVVVRDAFAADLDSGVHESFGPLDLELQA